MFHRIRSSLVSKIKAISIIGTVLTCILVFIITWHILYRLQLQNAYEIAQRDLKMTSYYIDTVIKKWWALRTAWSLRRMYTSC